MKSIIKISLFVLFGLLLGLNVHSQNRADQVRAQLDSLSEFIPQLKESSELQISNVPLHDYVRALGKVHRINLYIDNTEGKMVTTSMVDEPVSNILVFICSKFNLEIKPVGTILNLVPYVQKEKPKPKPIPKDLRVFWENDKLEFDLKNDTLSTVLKKLSRLSGKRLLLRPEEDGIVSGYVPPADFESGMESLLYMNGYNLRKSPGKDIFIISKGQQNQNGRNSGNQAGSSSGMLSYSLEILEDSLGPLIFLEAEKTPIAQVVRDLFQAMGREYYIFDDIQGVTTLKVQGATLDDVLSYLVRGTEFTWKEEKEVILIGKRQMEGLRKVKVINLDYRPTDKVIDLMPSEMKKGLELKEFVELNKIIVSGEPERIREVELFIEEIDQPVPMVRVEMLVVDVNFSRLLKTGVRAGLNTSGDSISGIKKLFPGLDYNLSGSEINDILGSSGIPALVNLGVLKSNFYLSIQAMESDGNVRVITNPVLSTLNGNEASITIGETRTFLLESNQFNNSAVNSFNATTQRFERIDINTTISVKPFVSHDGMVTMEVSPNFTEPGTQVDPQVPPDIFTRQFESTIRVKDGETVVLGGLKKELLSNTTTGLPWISRVPVLRWFFGNVNRTKQKGSLIVYITPTIYYY